MSVRAFGASVPGLFALGNHSLGESRASGSQEASRRKRGGRVEGLVWSCTVFWFLRCAYHAHLAHAL